MVIEIEKQFLRHANAGRYKPNVFTQLLAPLFPHTTVLATPAAVPQEEILVLDISFYQATADFHKMKSQGVDGVIIRAGQNTWIDNKANAFMTGALDVGLPIGSYWFFDSRSKPREQAALWSNVLAGFDAKLWCWADYEESYGGPYGGWSALYDFMEWCKFYMPHRKFGVYTAFYYWLEHCPNPLTQPANLNYFGQYPLWEANYTSDPVRVRIPKPWTEASWIFWQSASSGPGYDLGVGSKEVDVNQYMGTDFYREFGLEENEEPMPEKPVTYYMDLAASAVSNVRSGPGTTYPITVQLVGPKTVSITGEVIDNPNDAYEWYEIVAPVAGFVAKTSSYSPLRPAEPTPTPPVVPDVLYIGTKADGSDVKKYTA